jgi:hypothetical protein
MAARIVFVTIALLIAGSIAWAYRHDAALSAHAREIELGDPNEAVRELMGEPSSEGPCGRVSVAPSACVNEYLYKYYYTIFQPQYEVVWFNAEGKVIGGQHVQ